MIAQQQGRKRGAKCERVECRDHGRNGDGDGELLVELSADAADESSGDEYGAEH